MSKNCRSVKGATDGGYETPEQSRRKPDERGAGVGLAQLCYTLHKKGDYVAAVKYGKSCLSSYARIEALSQEDKLRANASIMIVADAYFCLKKYEEGLKWLAYVLHKCPDLSRTHAQAFDSFTALSPHDWHWTWLRMKTELGPRSRYRELSILGISDRKFSDPALALRKEINSYFCGKQALLEELIIAGEDLEDNASQCTDKALGILAQAIGFWWGNEEEENAATTLVKRSLRVLEEGAENEKNNSNMPQGVFSLVNALSTIWYAFCLLKNYHNRAVKDLEFARGLEKKLVPGKYSGVDTTGRIIPAIASLTIYDEIRIADLFIEAINHLYAIVQFQGLAAKAWIDHVGPALIVVTIRLLAHRVTMLGDSYNSIRIWYIAFVLGKWYDLRRLILLSGSELLKLIPDVSSGITNTLNDVCNYVRKTWPESSLAKSHILRLDLAKSIACLQKREYDEGLKYLKILFDYKTTLSDGSGNIDAISHLIAESHFVLAQYKALEISHSFKIDLGSAHTKLVSMSPSAIALKACKTLSGLSRSSVIRQGGWQDLGHNYHVFQTVTETYPTTLQLIKESGKMRDARVFIADFIFVAQQLCLISRTAQSLLTVIEVELITKAFDSAERKIECFLKLIDSCKKDGNEEDDTELPRTGPQALYDQLASLGINLTPEQLKKITYEWQLPDAKVPQKYAWTDRRFDRMNKIQWLPSQRITIPKYLSHSLDCCCYICRHPYIGALTVRFLQIQARFACYAERPSTSLSLLYCAKFYMVRALARSISQYFPLCTEIEAVLTPESVKGVVAAANKQYYFSTAFDWVTTLMEITPFEDIEMMIKQHNYVLEGIKIIDPKDKYLPLVPLEIMIAGIFGSLSKSNKDFAHGSGFREKYRVFAAVAPEVITLDSGADAFQESEDGNNKSPEILPSTPPELQTPKTPIVCAAAPKKRRGRPPKNKT